MSGLGHLDESCSDGPVDASGNHVCTDEKFNVNNANKFLLIVQAPSIT